MATRKQLVLIHIAIGQLNWDDEFYREVLQINYGVTSSKDLTEEQADDFIQALKKAGANIVSPRRRKDRFSSYDGRIGMATSRELRYIEALWYEVAKFPKALPRFLKKMGVESGKMEDISHDDAVRIIRALENMKRRGVKAQERP